MLKRVILFMNIEVDEVNTIRNNMNNMLNDEFVQYCTDDGVVFNTILSNVKKKYPSMYEAVKSKSFEHVVSSIQTHEELVNFCEDVFDKVNDMVYYRFEQNEYASYELHDLVILPTVLSNDEFKGDCIKIGWVTPMDVSHLVDHENMTSHTAERFQLAYADYLRKNKDRFDKFFDGDSIETVMEYIRST